MSVKSHFLDFHENLSEEHEESFHQNIKKMESRHQGRWNIRITAEGLANNSPQKITSKRSFLEITERFYYKKTTIVYRK